ncbi:unnamed protein product [Gadus morhua 'NCC']
MFPGPVCVVLHHAPPRWQPSVEGGGIIHSSGVQGGGSLARSEGALCPVGSLVIPRGPVGTIRPAGPVSGRTPRPCVLTPNFKASSLTNMQE